MITYPQPLSTSSFIDPSQLSYPTGLINCTTHPFHPYTKSCSPFTRKHIDSSIRSISQTLWSKSTYQLIHPVHLPNPVVQINLSTHPSVPSPKPCGPNQPNNSSIRSISQTLWSKSTYQLIHPVHLPNQPINSSIRSISQTLWSKSTYQLIHPVHLPNPVVQINLSTHPSGPSPKPCGPNQPNNSSIRSISQTLWSKSTYQLIHPVHLPNPVVQINLITHPSGPSPKPCSPNQLINSSIRSISQTLWSKSTYQLIHPVHLPNPVVQFLSTHPSGPSPKLFGPNQPINSSIRSISQTLRSKSTYQLIHLVHLPNPVVQINLSTHPSGPSPKPCGPNQLINSSIRSISQTLWSKSTYQLIHPVHLSNPVIQINLSTHPSGPSPKPCDPNQLIDSSIRSLSQTLRSKSTYQLIHPVHLPNPVVQINSSIRSIFQTLWSKSTYQLIHPVHLPNPVIQINLSTHPSNPSPKPCGPNQPINSSIRSIFQTLWSKSTYQLIHPVHLPNPVVQINLITHPSGPSPKPCGPNQPINSSIRSIYQTLWSKST